MRILVVEDELDLQDAIVEGLRLSGYAVDASDNGKDAFDKLFVEDYDLLILDLNIPEMNGLEVLKAIRDEKPTLKVLILSARSSVEDKVLGLDLGANDYLAKPFDFHELEARIRNLLRQVQTSTQTTLRYGNLVLDLSMRHASIGDEILNLTRKEYSILEYLLLHSNRVISAGELMDHIWDSEADSFSTSVRVHISSLRKKIKSRLSQDPIETRIGEGYIIIKDDSHV